MVLAQRRFREKKESVLGFEPSTFQLAGASINVHYCTSNNNKKILSSQLILIMISIKLDGRSRLWR